MEHVLVQQLAEDDAEEEGHPQRTCERPTDAEERMAVTARDVVDDQRTPEVAKLPNPPPIHGRTPIR